MIQKCKYCGGGGLEDGRWLEEHPEDYHLFIDPKKPCSVCGGTGWGGVMDRRIEIKEICKNMGAIFTELGHVSARMGSLGLEAEDIANKLQKFLEGWLNREGEEVHKKEEIKALQNDLDALSNDLHLASGEIDGCELEAGNIANKLLGTLKGGEK